MTMLDEIVARRREQVTAAKAKLPEAQLVDAVQTQLRDAAARNAESEQAVRARWRGAFAQALRGVAARGGRPIIAEFKRRSPSAGDLAVEADAGAQAQRYAAGGAAAMSVLTEPAYFAGSDEDLRAVRRACPALAILRKDFVVDAYQIWEARALGADAVLLITSVVGNQLGALLAVCRDAGITPLVEAHDRDEIDLAVAADAPVIGVNARDLKTFRTDLTLLEARLKRVPAGCLAVAESGIKTEADLERLARAGAHAFLIGETLMRASDPTELLRTWVRLPATVDAREQTA